MPCSLPEARSLIDAGKVRSLAVMATTRAALFPNVPTLKEATGSDWATGAWRGIAAPKGLPPAVAARLEASVKKAYDSKEYKDFMAQRGFGMLWGSSSEFAALHGQGRRRHEGRDDGRRHRQVAARRVQRTDRWVGLALALLGLAVLWSARAFPERAGAEARRGLPADARRRRPAAVRAGAGRAQPARAARTAQRPTTAPEARALRQRAGRSSARSSATSCWPSASASCSSRRCAWWRSSWRCACAGRRRCCGPSAARCVVHVAFYKLLRVPLPWGVSAPVLLTAGRRWTPSPPPSGWSSSPTCCW